MSEDGAQRDTGGVGPAVTFGLLAAWLVHDAEELVTGPRWLRARVPELRQEFPQVPERIWRRLESIGEAEFALAVVGVGLVMAAAAADGQRTGGRSTFHQTVLTGFGVHGLVHLAQAAAVRGYTPGSVSSPLVVLPFTLWARQRLWRSGVLRPVRSRDAVQGLALTTAVIAGAHGAARRLTARRRKH